MNIVTKATNLILTPDLQEYLEKKLSSLSKLVKSGHSEHIETRVELGRTTLHHKKGEVFFAEVNLSIGKHLLRARQETTDIHSAIDEVKDELKTELVKFKSKRETLFLRGARSIGKNLRVTPMARFAKK